MSIINQMLKDLEKRRPFNKRNVPLPESKQETLAFSNNSYNEIGKTKIVLGILLLGILGLAVGAFILKRQEPTLSFQQLPAKVVAENPISSDVRKQEPQPHPVILTDQKKQPPLKLGTAAIAPSAIENDPTQLFQMDVSTDPNLQMTFKFNKPVEYTIEDKIEFGFWQVIFKKTNLSETFVPPAINSRFLKSFEIQPFAGKVRVRLSFLRPMQVQSVLLPKQDTTEFKIALEQRPTEHNPEESLVTETEDLLPLKTLSQKEDQSDKTKSAAPIEKYKRLPSLQEKAEDAYQAGMAFMQTGELNAAIDKVDEALTLAPKELAFREARALLAIEMGDFLKAGQLINAGLMDAPAHLPFVKLKARLLYIQKKPELALTLLNAHKPSSLEDPEYFAFLGMLYQEIGQNKEAISAYEQALQVDKKQGPWYMGLGLAQEHEGQPKAALISYQMALKSGMLDAESKAFVAQRVDVLQQ